MNRIGAPLAMLSLGAGVLIFLTTVVPAAYVFVASFSGTEDMLQFDHYATVLSDSLFRTVFGNTVLFASGSALIQLALGLLLAKVLATSRMRVKMVLFAVLIVPWLVSEMASVIVWRWILAAEVGPLDRTATYLGLPEMRLLAKTGTVIPCLILISVWRGLAFATLFILGSLVTIPGSLYRVAAVEDLGFWRTLRILELPLLKGPLLSVLVVTTLHNMNQFTLPARLTGGGPRPPAP